MSQSVTLKNKWVICSYLLLFMLAMATNLAAAEISASVGAGTVKLNESFQLTLTASGSVDEDPDFTPLQRDFQILQQSQSSNLSIINGKYNSSKVWRLSLMPKRAGKLTLPAIAFGKDRSNSLTLQVVKSTDSTQAGNDSGIFIEVEVDNDSPYVQQQLVYTVRIYRSVAINSASLNNPGVAGGEALIEKTGDDRNSEVWKHNKRYKVIERRFLVVPQSSGELVIQPLQLEAQIIGNRRGSVFGLDPFSRSSSRTLRVESKPVTLNVRPVPAGFSGDVWLPARSLRLEEDWSLDPARLTTGEPVTRSVRVSVEGLSAVQLPPLQMHLPEGLKSYPDQPEFEQKPLGQSSLSSRVDKTAIIPSRAGRFTLPAVRIVWWNTETDQQEITELPGRVLSVTAAAGTQGGAVSDLNDAVQTSLQPDPAALPQTPLAQPATKDAASVWLYAVIVFLAIGWLLTLIAWWRARMSEPQQSEPGKPHSVSPSLSAIQRRMSLACVQQDAEAVKNCLLDWAACLWPDDNIRSLSAIAARVDGEFRRDIEQLERALYSRNTVDWDGKQLFEGFKLQQHQRAERPSAAADDLEPLYRSA